MKKRVLFLSILATISILAANAQSPMPVIVPANSSAAAPNPGVSSAPTLPVQDSDQLQAVIQLLEKMKVANEDLLRKQDATLQQLDELQTAAEQLKIFSKRG